MHYESGYFTVLSLILCIGTVIAICFVAFIYIKKVKKSDIRFIWFWLAAMSLVVTVPAFLVLVRPLTSQEINAMHSKENTWRLYWFGLWFIITNVLWIKGMFVISNEKKVK